MLEIESIPRVYLLAEHVANQIAAGEVIERPSSVVKELIENSFDSGARKIDIHIEKGGASLIHVIDDGQGIHPDDMGLALSSHATSKLRELDDLSYVNSLGFRGEALPSIASVSNFMLTSSATDSGEGVTASVEAHGQLEIAPAAHPRGTSVVVRNLFYQTPARKKFLRTDKTEFLHILETVKRMSLCRFGAELNLFHNAKQVFHSSRCDNNKDLRIAYIMGKSFIDKSHVIDNQNNGMHLWGRVGHPSESRSQSNRQYFYLNGRMIRDRHVNHAIRMAFDEKIADGRYPSYVLYLNMELSKSDINVHPSKYEVRFSDAREVHDFIYGSIKYSVEEQTDFLVDHSDATDTRASHQINLSHGSVREPVGSAKSFNQGVLSGGATQTPAFYDEFLGQINRRYLLTKKAEDLLFIDIFAVKKNVFRFQLEKSKPSAAVHSRPLLVPVQFAVTEQQGVSIEKFSREFAQFGLQINLMSANTAMVRTLPTPLEQADLRSVIDSICAVCVNKTEFDGPKVIESLIEEVPMSSVDSISIEEFHSLFISLAQYGIDTNVAYHKGLWQCLNGSEINNIMK
jgi:DNA mismatch repair protein MutL